MTLDERNPQPDKAEAFTRPHTSEPSDKRNAGKGQSSFSAPTPPVIGFSRPLYVPDISENDDVISAARKYAAAGWYVLPVNPKTKHAGSILGGGWPAKTSRDEKQIIDWFAGTDYALALHCGRSGAVCFDVDRTANVRPELRRFMESPETPYQSTRPDQPGRGHYLALLPADRMLSNSVGHLGNGWGEVRGNNGIILVAPSPHIEGGEYRWQRTGRLPVLPDEIGELLPDSYDAESAASDAQVEEFLDCWTDNRRPRLLNAFEKKLTEQYAAGESRHQSTVAPLVGAMKEAKVGCYPARHAADTLRRLFVEAAIKQPIPDSEQRKARTRAEADREFDGLLSWAVAQAMAANVAEIRARIEEKVPDTQAWVKGISGSVGVDSIDTLDADGKTNRDVLPPPTAPLEVAREIYTNFNADGCLTLRHWRGSFMEWSGPQWKEIEAAALESRVYQILGDAVYQRPIKQKGARIGYEQVPWNPNRNKVADVLKAMAAIGHLSAATDTPTWLDSHPNADDPFIACANGLLNLKTRTPIDHDPTYFNLIAVPFDYQPDAAEPTQWLNFLRTLWPDDTDSIALLQEFFGYILSGRTHMQKLLFLYGPKRSGKGTITRILRRLVGEGNYAGPTLANFTTEFGLQSLIGKSVAVIGDARLNSKNPAAVIERILSITGEDSLDINRKFKDPWTGKLPTRIVMLSNELPQLEDASGAIASRMLILAMKVSFFGREDHDLEQRLERELPAILNWALDGLDRLNQRGRFTIPRSSDEAMQLLADLSSPVGAFIREECESGSDYVVSKDDLFEAWAKWAEAAGHKPGEKNVFGRNLNAAVSLGEKQINTYDDTIYRRKRVRHWVGIRLRKDDPDDPAQDASDFAQDETQAAQDPARDKTPDQNLNAQDAQVDFELLQREIKEVGVGGGHEVVDSFAIKDPVHPVHCALEQEREPVHNPEHNHVQQRFDLVLEADNGIEAEERCAARCDCGNQLDSPEAQRSGKCKPCRDAVFKGYGW